MKTHLKLGELTIYKPIIVLSLFLFTALLSNPLSAQSDQQTISVKGVVNGEEGPLEGVNIYIDGSNTGTVSKSNGSFTFPGKVAIGDKLVFSYLGYVTKTIKISSNSLFLDVKLTEAPIEVLSSINLDKPYKSKRGKKD
ncbi:MAG: hypothetical protein ED556_11980 [Winogradskyella sp.]|uniref:carboxypeptidase-like regulatory domain-containing protein n=1 Tax=Winogradskyella sp. TaxID=1883156 RepID=UPI000F4060EF|nr:carboxypeptidase-like regulatory domain-containing protein [Winogradskyella sp.]RNC84169.1 MAG: hypothetical protein ED556_11980 [Winogradskyella sp.]